MKAPRSFLHWLGRATEERDASHDLGHFLRVRDLALDLADQAPAPLLCAAQRWRRPRYLLEIAALSHDVLDHKYVTDPATATVALRRALLSEAGLVPAEVDAVVLVVNNISLSQELQGALASEALGAQNLQGLRDLISDADKLEALGFQGLRRLAQYHQATRALLRREPKLTPETFRAYLTRECRRHLLHRAAYVRTPPGKDRAALAHEELLMILEDHGPAGPWADLWAEFGPKTDHR